MCAITLCSVCPTSSGRTRKAASTRERAQDHLERRGSSEPDARAHRGPQAGSGTPGGAILRRLGAPLRPARGGVALSPGSFAPGPRPCWPGRRGRTTCAAACPRSRPAAAAAAARGRCRRRTRRSRCRTSRASRARARPRRRHRSVSARHRLARRARGCARSSRRSAPAPERRRQVADDVEAGRLGVVGLVDGGEPVEEVEALVAGRAQGGGPLGRGPRRGRPSGAHGVASAPAARGRAAGAPSTGGCSAARPRGARLQQRAGDLARAARRDPA